MSDSVITTVRSSIRPGAGPLDAATRVVTGAWLLLSAINVIVWVMVAIISGSLDRPWFLWSVIGGGVVVLGLRGANRVLAGAEQPR